MSEGEVPQLEDLRGECYINMGEHTEFQPGDSVLEVWRAAAQKYTDTELEIKPKEAYHP
jgi:hypothetical protein